MKVLPSIAFGEFTGSAGDVTARSIGGRTILNHKAYQAKTKTPAQAVSRNTLSKVSRAYKQLTDSQMKAWGALAEHLKGISTFGKAAEMTAHNAFVRINANRSLVNMPPLEDAPEYKSDIPEVDYDDLWVSHDHIVFRNLNTPSDHHVLVLKMSGPESNGVTSGFGKTVIVEPGAVPDWGDADITDHYTKVMGFKVENGKKYFLQFWWMDKETGFTSESMWISTTGSDYSMIEHKLYSSPVLVSIDHMDAPYEVELTNILVCADETSKTGSFSGRFRMKGSNTSTWFRRPDTMENCPDFREEVLALGVAMDPGCVNLAEFRYREGWGTPEIVFDIVSRGLENTFEICGGCVPIEYE